MHGEGFNVGVNTRPCTPGGCPEPLAGDILSIHTALGPDREDREVAQQVSTLAVSQVQCKSGMLRERICIDLRRRYDPVAVLLTVPLFCTVQHAAGHCVLV